MYSIMLISCDFGEKGLEECHRHERQDKVQTESALVKAGLQRVYRLKNALEGVKRVQILQIVAATQQSVSNENGGEGPVTSQLC